LVRLTVSSSRRSCCECDGHPDTLPASIPQAQCPEFRRNNEHSQSGRRFLSLPEPYGTNLVRNASRQGFRPAAFTIAVCHRFPLSQASQPALRQPAIPYNAIPIHRTRWQVTASVAAASSPTRSWRIFKPLPRRSSSCRRFSSQATPTRPTDHDCNRGQSGDGPICAGPRSALE